MDQQIWLGIVEAERYYRYYHGLSIKLHKRQWLFDLLLLLPTAGVVGALAAYYLSGPTEALVWTILISVVGGVGVWQQTQRYAVKATAASMIALQYKMLSEDWRRQWRRGDDDEVVIALLTERLTSIASQHDLPFDRKLSDDAEALADKVISGEFSAAT